MCKTSIEWCTDVWNPVTGCSKVSRGCAHCYAERVFPRAYGKDRKFTDVRTHSERLDQPLRWKRPRRIFVNSMSDLFHEAVPDTFIAAVFAVMNAASLHTFQILTKRPERIFHWLRWINEQGGIGPYIRSIKVDGDRTIPNYFNSMIRTEVVAGKTVRRLDDPWIEVFAGAAIHSGTRPLPNVWLGVSVEDQKTADERIPLLLQTPAAVRFVSYEPALGPVDFHGIAFDLSEVTHDLISQRVKLGEVVSRESYEMYPKKVGIDALTGWSPAGKLPPLNWIIAGGESGPNARPAHPDWFRQARDQCHAAGVPFFFKQWGEWAPYDPTTKDGAASIDGMKPNHVHAFKDGGYALRIGKKAAGHRLDGREWQEFPK